MNTIKSLLSIKIIIQKGLDKSQEKIKWNFKKICLIQKQEGTEIKKKRTDGTS